MYLVGENQALPISLYDLLSNSLVLAQTCPYLRIPNLLALAATSKSFSSMIYGSPYSFRYLNLSTVKGGPLTDDGAIHARSVVGHANTDVTVDEFYSRALRWVFDSLERRDVLKDVTTLILDGLSVPGALLNEIICHESYSVRILSIRECVNLNEQTLLHILRYIIRPSRPEGTPKLKGLYYFGVTDRLSNKLTTARRRTRQVTGGVTSSPGAQLGMQLNQRSHRELVAGLESQLYDWYSAFGKLLSPKFEDEWVQMLQACAGIISFDAVLCRHNKESLWRPRIATISLGPEGCQNCHSSPEGPAFAGESPFDQLPLLAPPPLHASTVRAAQKPASGTSFTPPFFARCRDCLEGRWCERCNMWWCENCYSVPKAQMQAVRTGERHYGTEGNISNSIKVHLGLCVQGCLMEEMYHGAGEGGMWG